MKIKKQNINTGGGTFIGGNVNTSGGDFVGRDKYEQTGINSQDAAKIFASLYEKIDQHPRLDQTKKEDLKAEIEDLRKELAKKDQADETFLMRRFRNISRMAPDILEVTLAAVVHPALGLGVFAKKIAEKARSGF